MPSANSGGSTSAPEPEVVHIGREGLWLRAAGRERFLPFSAFPWFAHATVAELLQVRALTATHLYWPALDIDLTLEMIDHPEHFPLSARTSPA